MVHLCACVTDSPVYMCERGVGGADGAVSEALSLLSYTLRYVSLTDVDRKYQVGCDNR
jgi:hypothetical protein